MGAGLDVLVVGSFYLRKEEQNKELEGSHEELYKHD